MQCMSQLMTRHRLVVRRNRWPAPDAAALPPSQDGGWKSKNRSVRKIASAPGHFPPASMLQTRIVVARSVTFTELWKTLWIIGARVSVKFLFFRAPCSSLHHDRSTGQILFHVVASRYWFELLRFGTCAQVSHTARRGATTRYGIWPDR